MSDRPTKATLTVQEDENGEAFIEIPQEMIDSLGWKDGDDLVWSINEDGNAFLAKK